MKIISKKPILIEKIIEKTQPYYNRDIPELNELLYKYHYHDTVGRSWEDFLKSRKESELGNLLNDLKKTKL